MKNKTDEEIKMRLNSTFTLKHLRDEIVDAHAKLHFKFYCEDDTKELMNLTRKQAREEILKELKRRVVNKDAKYGNYALGDFGVSLMKDIINDIKEQLKHSTPLDVQERKRKAKEEKNEN